MGLILDSSVLIRGERAGLNARSALQDIARQIGEEEVAISVLTLVELAHGAARADTPARRELRERFVDELQTGLPVHPISVAVALRAGRLDGENASRGLRVPLADLLIGVTALELGYGVATSNPRHFAMIPGLNVVQV